MSTVYTTYFGKLRYIPDKKLKKVDCLAITRWTKPSLLKNDKVNIEQCSELAPSSSVLRQYKEDNDFEKFAEKYLYQIENRQDLIEKRDEILKGLLKGKDYLFICYEKEPEKCHRSLIAKWFVEQDKSIKWVEL